MMDLKEKIGVLLDEIKQLKGVEYVVLSQRNGNPIQSAGVTFSKGEISNFSSEAGAIYNLGINWKLIDLKYIVLEGKKANILIAPLNSIHYSLNRILSQQRVIDNKHEFFISITARPNADLKEIFLQTSDCLKKIKSALINSGEFKLPIVQFNAHRSKI